MPPFIVIQICSDANGGQGLESQQWCFVYGALQGRLGPSNGRWNLDISAAGEHHADGLE